MKSAVQAIALLAFISICSSKKIRGCHCRNTVQSVKRSLITDAMVYTPNSFCHKFQIVVTLKNGRMFCLEPQSKFGSSILKKMRNDKKTRINLNTTTMAAIRNAPHTYLNRSTNTATTTSVEGVNTSNPGETVMNCRCPKTTPVVRRHLIADVEVYQPRPYCNRLELIVILKDKSKKCLDPQTKFAKKILQAKEKQEVAQKTL